MSSCNGVSQHEMCATSGFKFQACFMKMENKPKIVCTLWMSICKNKVFALQTQEVLLANISKNFPFH